MQRWWMVVVAAAVVGGAASWEARGDETPKSPVPSVSPKGDAWVRSLSERGQRGTLHAAQEQVRGDSGKWRDDPALQHVPAVSQKPQRLKLDDWADQWLERRYAPAENDGNCLLLRTRQLDDNDRVWVERVERRGNKLTVVVKEAVWQGRYSKNFTYYGVIGVDVGQLPPGVYEATCSVQRLEFREFEDPGKRTESWPRGERAAGDEPVELRVTFTVAAERE
jgi:hypothetical protein